MPLTKEDVLRILYPKDVGLRSRRYTQDSPILADVWIAYCRNPESRQELLLTPHIDSSVGALVLALRERLKAEGSQLKDANILYNESHVLARLTFRELIRAALPLSSWWKKYLKDRDLVNPAFLRKLAMAPDLVELLIEPAKQDPTGTFSENLLQLARIAGAGALGRPPADGDFRSREYWKAAVEALATLLEGFDHPPPATVPPLWSVSCNRVSNNAVWRSRRAVKADAAVRLFNIRCQEIRWAVIDSGVDARHVAFCKKPPADPTTGQGECAPQEGEFSSRILKTYDFMRLRDILNPDLEPGEAMAGAGKSALDSMDPKARRRIERDLRRRLITGQVVDWELLEPLLRVPHDKDYPRPVNEHGTHVAGILGASWTTQDGDGAPDEKNLIGMCPDIEMYDLRVFDDEGAGDEFTIIAALQFIRHLNSHKDQMVIHGVNLSMSLEHDVRNFACGRTPICEEAMRLVGSGVVVVTAAGNRGYSETYNAISITDPGNAEGVITVGATHRFMPHTYGVSYFSSRGPTGDGRMKPDLVAPGE